MQAKDHAAQRLQEQVLSLEEDCHRHESEAKEAARLLRRYARLSIFVSEVEYKIRSLSTIGQLDHFL